MNSIRYVLGGDRFLRLIALLCLVELIYYVGPLRSWTERDQALNARLSEEWAGVVDAYRRDRRISRLDLSRINESLRVLRTSGTDLSERRPALMRRISLADEITARLGEPFQLIEFVNESQIRIEDVKQQAKAGGTSIAFEISNVFPEFTSDNPSPWLLWAQLELCYQASLAAIESGAGELTALKLKPPHPYYGPGGGDPFMMEVPLELELAGSMRAVVAFLSSLPLTANEADPLGLAAVRPDKPALFLDRLLIRKAAPDQADRVDVAVTLSGLVYR